MSSPFGELASREAMLVHGERSLRTKTISLLLAIALGLITLMCCAIYQQQVLIDELRGGQRMGAGHNPAFLVRAGSRDHFASPAGNGLPPPVVAASFEEMSYLNDLILAMNSSLAQKASGVDLDAIRAKLDKMVDGDVLRQALSAKANQSEITSINDALQTKATHSDLEAGLAEKVDQSDIASMNASLQSKATHSDLEAGLVAKANQSQIAVINALLQSKAPRSDLEAGLAAKANQSQIAVINALLQSKATHSDLEAGLAAKANQSQIAVINALLQDKADSSKVPCSGKTKPGSTNWVQYGDNAIYVDVDASSCGFAATPVYVTNLGGDGFHYVTTGSSQTYQATAKGFRIYINDQFRKIAPKSANDLQWHIQWMGLP